MLKALSALSGIAGQETELCSFIMQLFDHSQYAVSVDTMGNLMIRKDVQSENSGILVTAHLDEPGLIVTKITDEGYLKFDIVGDLDSANIISKRVTVNGYPGVIGCKAIHLTTKEEREQQLKVNALFIDIGAKNKATAAAVVCPGDSVVFDSGYAALGNSYIKAKALRSRTGCAVLCRLLKESTVPFTALFTSQKETGGRGAEVAVQKADFTKVIVLDCIDSDQPSKQHKAQVCLGKGPALSIVQTDTVLRWRLQNLAEDYKIPLQPETAAGYDPVLKKLSGVGNGIPGALLRIPCRYMRSCSNVIDSQDLLHCYQLIKLLLEEEK